MRKKNSKNFKNNGYDQNLTKKNTKQRVFTRNAISDNFFFEVVRMLEETVRVLEETMRMLVEAIRELVDSIRGPEKSDFEA